MREATRKVRSDAQMVAGICSALYRCNESFVVGMERMSGSVVEMGALGHGNSGTNNERILGCASLT